jgi:hypothetical protein
VSNYPVHQGGRESQQQQAGLVVVLDGRVGKMMMIEPWNPPPLAPKSNAPAPPTHESAWRE